MNRGASLNQAQASDVIFSLIAGWLHRLQKAIHALLSQIPLLLPSLSLFLALIFLVSPLVR